MHRTYRIVGATMAATDDVLRAPEGEDAPLRVSGNLAGGTPHGRSTCSSRPIMLLLSRSRPPARRTMDSA